MKALVDFSAVPEGELQTARDVADWPVPVSAADLCATPPPTPPELISGVLFRTGTFMMSGASKGRKSWTQIDAGISIAAGLDWLGFKCSQTPVLYLNFELQDFAVEARIKSICKAKGIPPPRSLHVLNLRGKLVTLEALEKRLPEWMEATGAGLVMADPHYKVSSASGFEENSNDGQGELLYRLESLVCSRGAALMLAHHFAKGDSSSKKSIDRAAGGGVLARWPDVVMTITEHEAEECVTADFTLRNFKPVPPFVLRWQHPVWVRDDGLNPALLKKAGRNDEHPASELASFLGDGMTSKEWREASGWSDGTFRRKKEELISTNKVRLTAGCFYHVAP